MTFSPDGRSPTDGVRRYDTWQPYPADVALSRRLRCCECRAPGAVVCYHQKEIIGPATAFASIGDDVRSMFAVYCMACAKSLDDQITADPAMPAHLNHLQRWLADVLDSGGPDQRS